MGEEQLAQTGNGRTPSSPPAFACSVMGVDEAWMEIAKQRGDLVYVRIEEGALPAPLLNVLVRSESGGRFRMLFGRPAKGAFAPLPVTLVMPSRRAYRLTLLTTLPALGMMRPHLRAGLQPPEALGEDIVPVALAGLFTWCLPVVNRFRPLGGRLVSGWDPPIAGLELQPEGMPWERVRAIKALERSLRQGDAQVTDALIVALQDEIEGVRAIAARLLTPVAARLPVAPFLDLAQDTTVLNESACLVAAAVFGMHSQEVPIERVIALFRDAPSPNVAAMAVGALGRYGDHAPVEILANILRAFFTPGPYEFRMMTDVRVHQAAGHALRELGDRAPVDALMAGLADTFSAKDAANALLAHAGPVPEEALRAAERIVRGEVASVRIPPTR